MTPYDEKVLKFNRDVIETLKLIQTALEKDADWAEKTRLPPDWKSAQSILRNVAEDLMLCSDANEAITRLLRDQEAARIVVYLAKSLNPKAARITVKRAFSKAPSDFSILPCVPLAWFLIELCDGSEMIKPD